MELTHRVCTSAGRLAGEHALRGADAVHLASALALGTPDVVVAGWHGRLRAGARSTGLRVAPPG